MMAKRRILEEDMTEEEGEGGRKDREMNENHKRVVHEGGAKIRKRMLNQKRKQQ